MADIREQIRQADEDYLTGISNKGIVKRAGKDLEKETPTVSWNGEEAQVALKEETCVIRVPLGDSTCSCPSTNICRHVVTAILWLRGELKKEAEAGQPTGLCPSKEAGLPEASHDFSELGQIPAVRLKRACGGQRYRRLLSHLRAGDEPSVTETSIVTVRLPWEEAVVKLLTPLEHSTCTCHSRELCAHKAQALLIWQLQKGLVSLEQLEALLEEEEVLDMEAVRAASSAVRAASLEQLNTGLSRQSPEVGEALERLAVLCHRAGLARLENRLRETEETYRQYFARSAAFRTGELAGRLLLLYNQAGRIHKEEKQEELQRLAGSFRESYEPVGNLHLMGVGARSFTSKNGYEGETWYFLEVNQRRWYTWTDARPVFYEGVKNRTGQIENTSAPWNLSCRREELSQLEFELSGARAAAGRRLSASQETRGQLLGSRNLETPAFAESIVWDYEKLLRERFQPGEAREKGGRLALVGAAGWEEPVFDRVAQRFSWELHDEKGRSLEVRVKYTKKEQLTIQFLERLESRLRGQKRESAVFFGALYLEEGRLCLYPIEFYPQAFRRPEEVTAAMEEENRIPEAAVKALSHYVEEAFSLLSDLFTSGLASASPETVSALQQLSEDGERMGLDLAARELGRLNGLLQEKRHRMEFSPEPAADVMERLWRYLTVCREKLFYDEAVCGLRGGSEPAGEIRGAKPD